MLAWNKSQELYNSAHTIRIMHNTEIILKSLASILNMNFIAYMDDKMANSACERTGRVCERKKEIERNRERERERETAGEKVRER